MDVAGVREALHKQPFDPFVVCLADGRTLPVPHPDFVAIHPRRIVVIADDGSWSVVEPLLIASLDYSANPKRRGNGKKKKKRRGS